MSTTPAPGITTWPVFIDGEPFTIHEVHDGDRLGDVTLSGIEGTFPIHASAVPRRLYAIRGQFGLVTGSFGQDLSWTWSEATEWIERVTARPENAGLTFTIEVAR